MSSLASGPDTAASLPPASLDRRFYAFALDRAIAWGLDALAVVVEATSKGEIRALNERRMASWLS